MAILACILGILGGLCAVMGIITAAGVISLLGAGFTVTFWLMLGAVLLLGSIVAALFRSSYE